MHILHQVLPLNTRPHDKAQAVAQIRAAALQDESGSALDRTLRAHGAAARPVPVQPIRWMKNPRQTT